MRCGIIVRANQKGLGTQTRSAANGYPFDRQLLVLDGNRRVPEHPQWYPDALVAHIDREHGTFRNPECIERFVDGLDVIFSVETLYDWRLADAARAAGCVTIVQGNPEFYRPDEVHAGAPKPDFWTWPTPWLVERLPRGPVLAVPTTGESWAVPAELDAEPLVIVHVGGFRANGDRNGTDIFVESLMYLTSTPVSVRVYGQDGVLPDPPRITANVEVEFYPHGVVDRWSMYDGAHLLVMPRRYGGLCLPVQEALESGLAVAMSDHEPNSIWPNQPIPAGQGRLIRTPFAPLLSAECHPKVIARAISTVAQDRALLADLRDAGGTWATMHSWNALRDAYTALFERCAR